ncbi:hypothetical protein [Nocardioides sambongensis]|uniref:hypothetical protein n=1 Tax=Nocardioides sambongensis TaxID=2589074 RepID=UPI00112995A8|nr:hypothetical protein [Nocardioides sambongensis]
MAQDDATFDLIRWEDGERPIWWRRSDVLWKFKTDQGRLFVTTDLDHAYTQLLANEARATVHATRRALFLQLPTSQLDFPVRIPGLRVTAELTLAAPALRTQLELLGKFKSWLKSYEETTRFQVLEVAQLFAERLVAKALEQGRSEHEAYSADAVACLFDLSVDDGLHCLGVTPKQLQRWAADTQHFELRQLCAAEVKRRDDTRLARVGAAAETRDGRARRAADERGLREFLRWLKEPDFVPENEAERYALLLHHQIDLETDGTKRDALTARRDRFIVEFVVGAAPIDTCMTLPRLLKHLEELWTPKDKQ